MRKFLVAAFSILVLAAGIAGAAEARQQPPQASFSVQFQATIEPTPTPTETPVPWVPYEYVQRYQGSNDEIIWAIILTLQDSGVNMDRIERLLLANLGPAQGQPAQQEIVPFGFNR